MTIGRSPGRDDQEAGGFTRASFGNALGQVLGAARAVDEHDEFADELPPQAHVT
jgi:hypothetical protein